METISTLDRFRLLFLRPKKSVPPDISTGKQNIDKLSEFRPSYDSGVNIRIVMTVAQNDERGDQGLARTVDKQKLKTDFVRLEKMGF